MTHEEQNELAKLKARIAELEAKLPVPHHMGCPAINGYEGVDSKCLCGADEVNQHI